MFCFPDEPSQPGRPNILDWGPNHCDLSWAVPESDGGAPITHYVIEIKVGSRDLDNFIKCNNL